MSDTPRVDARERIVLGGVGGDFKVVLSDFARQLERELASANARIKSLEEAVKNLAKAEGEDELLRAIREFDSLL